MIVLLRDSPDVAALHQQDRCSWQSCVKILCMQRNLLSSSKATSTLQHQQHWTPKTRTQGCRGDFKEHPCNYVVVIIAFGARESRFVKWPSAGTFLSIYALPTPLTRGHRGAQHGVVDLAKRILNCRTPRRTWGQGFRILSDAVPTGAFLPNYAPVKPQHAAIDVHEVMCPEGC